MTPEERAKDLLPKLLVTSDAPIRAAHEILLATALREAEQSAFERAAKVAETAVGDWERDTSGRTIRETRSGIAQSIRDLGKQKA